jgi:tRNA (cmo5U34)-methyltransferase
MLNNIVIRDDINKYMNDLRRWLSTVRDIPLEPMSEFFTKRIDIYEQKMSEWNRAYKYLPSLIPDRAKRILDLGCGTGLELDSILAVKHGLCVTGIDLCETMLSRLSVKHPEVKLICADYFEYDFGENKFDAAISFESLHHFKPAKKLGLFKKVFSALVPGGVFINVDYIASCDEEEKLLMDFCNAKRLEQGIPDGVYTSFDTPLTAEHECGLLRSAGFVSADLVESIDGASFIVAKKN